MRGVQGRSVGDSAEQAMTLRTARLILTPLSPLDEGEHARASGNSDDALRDTRAAELQWRGHGFGPWAIRDLGDNSFLGAAELRFAGDGIEGIAPNEVEAGWWVSLRSAARVFTNDPCRAFAESGGVTQAANGQISDIAA